MREDKVVDSRDPGEKAGPPGILHMLPVLVTRLHESLPMRPVDPCDLPVAKVGASSIPLESRSHLEPGHRAHVHHVVAEAVVIGRLQVQLAETAVGEVHLGPVREQLGPGVPRLRQDRAEQLQAEDNALLPALERERLVNRVNDRQVVECLQECLLTRACAEQLRARAGGLLVQPRQPDTQGAVPHAVLVRPLVLLLRGNDVARIHSGVLLDQPDRRGHQQPGAWPHHLQPIVHSRALHNLTQILLALTFGERCSALVLVQEGLEKHLWRDLRC
mmetsp:Transcript_111320/g.314894  ORF Transcript_111320/g.314894 Transcript_111320/m.314894 type:complete len:274 (+) Transcript_111320:977-1798(+)